MKKIEKAISLVNAAKTVAVFSHAGYDGDAIGSMFGLAEFLKKQGKKEDCRDGCDHCALGVRREKAGA